MGKKNEKELEEATKRLGAAIGDAASAATDILELRGLPLMPATVIGIVTDSIVDCVNYAAKAMQEDKKK